MKSTQLGWSLGKPCRSPVLGQRPGTRGRICESQLHPDLPCDLDLGQVTSSLQDSSSSPVYKWGSVEPISQDYEKMKWDNLHKYCNYGQGSVKPSTMAVLGSNMGSYSWLAGGRHL